jgi:tRNA (adenine22-N1)-methyltransferase
MRLSARLLKIAELVKSNSIIADIGTDHAFLPIYLIKKSIVEKAIAIDVNQGPYNKAKKMVAKYRLEGEIDVRLGSGLEPIKEADGVQTIIIAGMGGRLIAHILATGAQKAAHCEQIILQPMQDGEFLRRWLQQNEYKIVDEEIVRDGGHLYDIIIVRTGHELPYKEILYEVGPINYLRKHPLLKEKAEKLRNKYIEIQRNIMDVEGIQDYKKEINYKIKQLERIINATKGYRDY